MGIDVKEKVYVTVTKNGEDKTYEVDLDENENLENTLKKMARKNKC